MPTSVGPNTKGEENLVFGYDLGDVSNSYKGEPATNSQDYDKSVMTQAGFDAWGCYDGNNSSPNYHYWGNAQSKTLVNIPGPDGKYVNAMLYHNFTGGFHGPTNWSGVASSLLTNGSKITVQGWVKAADAASVGKTVSPHLYYGKIGGGSYSSSTSYTLTAEWQLVSHSYTVPEGSTGAGTMYFFTSGGTNIKMYLTNTAIVGGRVHAIQWLPGGTTRSATQGLLDLTGNSTIDLTNVSFDSNAQMTFDGTNDYVDLSSATSLLNLGSTFSIEGILKLDNTSQEFGTVFSSLDVATGSQTKGVGFYWKKTAEYGMSANTLRLQLGLTLWGWHIFASNGISISDTNYHHVAVTLTGGNTSSPTIVFYIDGVAQAATKWTAGSTGAINNSSNANSLRLGSIYTASDPSYNNLYSAELLNVIKIYNRVLTASEIKSNYNAIKGRFNL